MKPVSEEARGWAVAWRSRVMAEPLSSPAWNIRIRSRFDSCRVLKLEISRPNMSTGAAIRKITSSGTAHASSRGREQTMTTKSATVATFEPRSATARYIVFAAILRAAVIRAAPSAGDA